MVIVDTGFWVALASRQDRHHARATALLKRVDEPLICTWPVMTETCHLLATRVGPESLRAFVESYGAGAFQVFDLSREPAPRILEPMETYANLPMDLADASLVLLAEQLGHGRILSTDERDFGTYRWKRQRPFENLLISGS